MTDSKTECNILVYNGRSAQKRRFLKIFVHSNFILQISTYRYHPAPTSLCSLLGSSVERETWLLLPLWISRTRDVTFRAIHRPISSPPDSMFKSTKSQSISVSLLCKTRSNVAQQFVYARVCVVFVDSKNRHEGRRQWK